MEKETNQEKEIPLNIEKIEKNNSDKQTIVGERKKSLLISSTVNKKENTKEKKVLDLNKKQKQIMTSNPLYFEHKPKPKKDTKPKLSTNGRILGLQSLVLSSQVTDDKNSIAKKTFESIKKNESIHQNFLDAKRIMESPRKNLKKEEYIEGISLIERKKTYQMGSFSLPNSEIKRISNQFSPNPQESHEE